MDKNWFEDFGKGTGKTEVFTNDEIESLREGSNFKDFIRFTVGVCKAFKFCNWVSSR